jgi:hypothetical protein
MLNTILLAVEPIQNIGINLITNIQPLMASAMIIITIFCSAKAFIKGKIDHVIITLIMGSILCFICKDVNILLNLGTWTSNFIGNIGGGLNAK